MKGIIRLDKKTGTDLTIVREKILNPYKIRVFDKDIQEINGKIMLCVPFSTS